MEFDLEEHVHEMQSARFLPIAQCLPQRTPAGGLPLLNNVISVFYLRVCSAQHHKTIVRKLGNGCNHFVNVLN
jgi:hypothetical protein